MAGTRLRLPNGTQLSPELSKNLELIIGPIDSEYCYYEEKPDSSSSYNQRKESLYNAFLFILQAYPPSLNPQENHVLLEKYAEIAKNSCVFNKEDSIEVMQNNLKMFTADLINVLVDCWDWRPKDKAVEHAIECLNEAEQYVLMQTRREGLATLVPKLIKNKLCYILQWEEVIKPGRTDWYDELRHIQQLGAPKTPSWFYNLNHSEQEYIANFTGNSADLKTDIKGLLEIFTMLQNIKPTSLAKDLATTDWANITTTHLKNVQPHQAVFIKANLPTNFEQMEKILLKFQEKCPTNIEHLNTLPLWYTALSNTQQAFLGQVLKNAGDKPLEQAINWLSTRHRTLPALANARRHHMFILDEHGEELYKSKIRYGSSHIVSRDVLRMSKAVIKKHRHNNLQQICDLATDQQPIIIQTLISPVKVLNYLPAMVANNLPPDLELFNQLEHEIAEYQGKHKIIQTNHPLNIVKYYNYTTSPGSSGCNSLLELTKKQLSNGSPLKYSSLIELTNTYEQVLNSKIGSATICDYRGRELFLSSLEQLIILELNGLSYGSCVSGKDRKAIEFIHTDAMLIYFYIYGKWHIFNDSDKDRNNFVQIVTDLFVSRHQQQHAGQNAPGSDALKTPKVYWPKDISEAIERRIGDSSALTTEDRIASNNEVAKIGAQTFIKPGLGLCKLVGTSIGEDKCQKIIDALCPIMEERERFKKSWVPTLLGNSAESYGIQEIRKLLDEKKITSTATRKATETVAHILHVITNRPESNEGRTKYTIAVYQFGHSIYKKPQLIDTTLSNMTEFYSNILLENRGKTCQAC